MIKGFIFDLDGVITDTAEYHFQAWNEISDVIGIKLTREFNEELKGISRMDSLEKIIKYGNLEGKFTQYEKEDLADKKNEIYKNLILNINPSDILEGIKELLIQLKKENYKVGLASASKNGPSILKQLDLYKYFDTIVDPSSLKKGKPDPEILLKACEQLNLKPSECIGIEDSQSGIQSINEAGMFSVGVGEAESMMGASYYVANTKELNLTNILEKVRLNKVC